MRTFHGRDIDVLPPSLWPCAPTDGPDQRFLDIHVPPLPIQLRRPLGCDSYNHLFFDSSLRLQPSSPDQPLLPAAPLQDADEPPLTFQPDPSLKAPPSISDLHTAISSSIDKLFFIAYRFQSALRPIYALVQVDTAQTKSDASTTGVYHCHFFAAPSADRTLPEHLRRWWPLWHRYTTGDDGVIDYHERVEFSPSTTPNPLKCIAWADSIPLHDPAFFLQGPFDFIPPADASDRSRTPSFRQYLPLTRWELLHKQCNVRGIIPPTLTPSNSRTSTHLRRKRRAKHKPT